MKTLSNVPSQLLEQALKDLGYCASHPEEYSINMGNWHRPMKTQDSDTLVCDVCLAGAVMARTFGVSSTEYASPGCFAEPIRDKLQAIDSLSRFGDWETFVCVLAPSISNRSLVELRQDVEDAELVFIPWDNSPEEWYAYMSWLISIFKYRNI